MHQLCWVTSTGCLVVDLLLLDTENCEQVEEGQNSNMSGTSWSKATARDHPRRGNSKSLLRGVGSGSGIPQTRSTDFVASTETKKSSGCCWLICCEVFVIHCMCVCAVCIYFLNVLPVLVCNFSPFRECNFSPFRVCVCVCVCECVPIMS